MWSALRTQFPDALAACLMGNHIHLIVPDGDPWPTLCRVLGSLEGWPYGRPPPPEVAADRVKIRRDIRYVLLNPCRAEIATDPLQWVWSTHRDLVGAVRDPWVDAGALARLGIDHAYVSGDPSVAVAGTPAPVAARRGWNQPLARIASAAMAATRCGPDDLRRRTEARTVFLQLARANGWPRATLLAELCGVQRAAVHRAWRRPDVTAEAQLCLGDDRLLARLQPSSSPKGGRRR